MARYRETDSAKLTAVEYQRILSSSIYPMRLSLGSSANNFCAYFESRSFGDICLIRASANQPISLSRQPNATNPNGDILLKYQTTGRTLHRHDGTNILSGSNSLLLVRPDQEESAEQIDPASAVLLRLPADLLGEIFDVNRFGGCYLLGCPDSLKTVFRDILETMWLQHVGMGAAERRALSTILRDLVVASLTADCFDEKTETASRAKILEIKSVIRNNLSDPDLSLKRLSGKVGMSRSTLCATAKAEGTTVRTMIIDLRLQAIHNALLDPHMDRYTISSIIYRFGFEDISHCIRRFKQKYGDTPAAYRRNRANN